MVKRRSPITEQRYEVSFLEGLLLTFFGSHTFTCKEGWEGVCLSVACVGLTGF